MNNEVIGNKEDEIAETASEIRASAAEKSLLFIVMAVVLLLDQLSKIIIENSLSLNESWVPFPSIAQIFRVTHIGNTGAAFGLFPSGSSVFMIVAVIVTIVIVIYNHQIPADNGLFRIALGLQMGGALGNLVNRIRVGHVTDFLDFGPVPIFNVADSSIVVGVAVLIFLMFLDYAQERRKVAEEASALTEVNQELAEPIDEQSTL